MDCMRQESQGRDANLIEQLLKKLAELRELDRRRQAHAPGSAAHDAATLEVDLRSRRLMDAFRDLQRRRTKRLRASTVDGALHDTRPIDARRLAHDGRGSRLN